MRILFWFSPVSMESMEPQLGEAVSKYVEGDDITVIGHRS
jgi:hypothetical protein